MLVNLTEIINDAVEEDYAVPAFNIFGYEDAIAVVRAAEELGAPVILQANIPALNHMPVEYLAPIMCRAAEEASVPVCVHLDHANDFSVIERAVKNGFTSVMYDGSQLPLEENIKNTIEVVNFARANGVSVEAEIGSVGYSDPSVQAKHIYTEPREAELFANATGVDALAVAVGTVHRMEQQNAKIQYDRLEEIQKLVVVPLVIHGATGINDEDLRKLATYRVGKVNIGTSLRMAFGNTLRQEIIERPNEFDRIRLFRKPMQAVKEEAIKKLSILGFQQAGK